MKTFIFNIIGIRSAYAILLEDLTIQLKQACCNSGLALLKYEFLPHFLQDGN